MREMLRLQGFPDTFKIACGYSATRKQAGNSVPVPMIQAVVEQVFFAIKGTGVSISSNNPSKVQPKLFKE
jgi:site-specific DNA-cytosine methylase